ncbi:MAG: response regulator transcription factor [Candidatus Rokuibacteriota bacterium]
MNVLVADDEAAIRRLVEATLQRAGYGVVTAADGAQALALLRGPGAPPLAILDWMMPGLTGPEVCRQARLTLATPRPYVILLTSRDRREDIVAGLEAGADDYIAKPFDVEELRARVGVGARMVELQQALSDRVRALEDALARVTRLQGLLPICGWCKRIRNDRNYWQQVESYIAEHSGARFTHGICPECREKVTQEFR